MNHLLVKYFPILNLLKVNTFSFFLNIFQQLFYIPIIVYFIGSSEYASWTVAMATGAFMTLAGLGLIEYLNVYVANEIRESRNNYVSNVLINFFIILILLSFVIFITIFILFKNKLDVNLLLPFIFYSFLGLLISILSIYYRAYDNIIKYIKTSNELKFFEILISSICLSIYKDIFLATYLLVLMRVSLFLILLYNCKQYILSIHKNLYFKIDFKWLKKAFYPASGTFGINIFNTSTNQYFLLWIVDKYSSEIFTVFNILRVILRIVNKLQNIVNYTLLNSYIHNSIVQKDAGYIDKLSLIFSYTLIFIIFFCILTLKHNSIFIENIPYNVLVLLFIESLFLLYFQKETTKLSSTNNHFKSVFSVLIFLFPLFYLHSNDYIDSYIIYMFLFIPFVSIIKNTRSE